MSEMIDRIVAAIRREAETNWNLDISVVLDDEMNDLARSIISAMREVPHDMFLAAERAGISFQTQQRVWPAMIDAARNQPTA